MKNNLTLLSIFLSLFLSIPLSSQSLAEGELTKNTLNTVEFINYVGPHAYVNSREEILNIGRSLARGVVTTNRFTLGNKYAVVRVFTPGEPKLSADILILLPESGVDHIRNLNLIVAGYLEGTFNYPSAHALLLADFITRYNAVYRGNMTYASQMYSTGVLAEITSENMGLSRVFSEWAGKSRILIPLMSTLSQGDRGIVHSDVISSPEVIKDLQKEPGGLEQRKDLVNLKEQEIALEQQAIAQKEQELNQREADLKKQNETPAGENSPESPGTTETQAVTDTPTGEKNTDPQTPQAEADLVKIQQERQALQAKKDQLDQREAILQEDRKEVAAADTQRLAADEQKKTDPVVEPQKTVMDLLTFFTITDSEGQFGQITVVDMKSSSIQSRSTLNTIRSRKFEVLGNSYVVIAGRSEGTGVVHLFTLKKDDLQIELEGKDNIAPQSNILMNGNQFFAVLNSPEGEWKLGLFNEKLIPTVLSTESVLPGSLIQIKGTQILIQGKNGKILLLNAKTLKKEGEFRG